MIFQKIKHRKFTGICLLVALMTLATACEDRFNDVNTPEDRLLANQLDAKLVGQAFAYAQYYGMLGQRGPFQLYHSLFSDIYAQYFETTHESFPSDQFVEVGRWINGAYTHLYSGPAVQVNLVEEFTAENGMTLENAMAKVWKVQFYHRITDYWGPIVYSEFGNEETSVAFDSQEFVYNDFFRLLDEAVSVLSDNAGGTSGPLGPSDVIYDGDVDKWLKFANSLRLRLAMRVVYADEDLARSEAEKAINAPGGVMTSNADNAMVLTTDSSLNPYTVITQWGEFRMSATMESVLNGYNDPRTSEYFIPAEETGEYHGMRNGVPDAFKSRSANNPKGSDMGIRWLPLASDGENYDIAVMRAPEIYFLRAEGALRGWNMGGGTPQSYYEEGIRMSMMEYTDADASAINAYIASNDTPAAFTSKINSPAWDLPPMSDITVAWEGAADPGFNERNLEQIITQKWIALYPDSEEAWAERRRTGYPIGYAIVESANPDLSETDLFRRMTFVSAERTDNSEATQAAEGLLDGPDANTTRVWWDAKPIGAFPPIPTSN